MNGEESWTLWDWALMSGLAIVSLFFLGFGLSLVWGVIAKEEYGDCYRPWPEILARLIVFPLVLLILGVVVATMQGCYESMFR